MIAIIDYGMGNLRSVQKALESLSHEAIITDEPAQLFSATHVILPGVGAFGDAMARLEKTGLDKAVKEIAASGKPLLGICLGMQLLFRSSSEGGEHPGLGLIDSDIVRFPADMGLKVPHMGWNCLKPRPGCPLFEGVGEAPYVYFVHSYYAAQVDARWTAATCEYGAEFTAAVQCGNVFGTQYHPEKSGAAGLAMLKNFTALTGEGASC